jgi:hypothetical protein
MKSTSSPRDTRGAWERATAPDPTEIADRVRARRIAGVTLGALLGLSYGLVSQLINPIAISGVPLYQPPLGAFGNIMASILVGALLGALSCIPDSAPLGVFYASLASALAIATESILRLGGLIGVSAAVMTSIVFSVPFAWLTVPVTALLRWSAERQTESLREEEPLLHRVRWPVVLMLVMGVLGAFELLPIEGRTQLRQTHEMLQAGLQGRGGAQTAPLRGPLMTSFPTAPQADYSLQWTRWDLDRFIELRPPSSYNEHAAVIARFGDDYSIVCLYPTPRQAPNCKNYAELPRLNAPPKRDDAADL